MTDISNFGDIQFRDLAARDGSFFNPVASDGSGARDITLDFKGKKLDATVHELASLKVSHSGTGDDFKGQYVFGVNAGADVDGSLTSGLTVASGMVTAHTAATVGTSLSVGTTATVGTGLTVSAGGVDVTGASTFEDAVTLNATGTALDVASGNMNVAGTLTVDTINATTYADMSLAQLVVDPRVAGAEAGARHWVDDTAQSFSGSKTFWDLRSSGGFYLGTNSSKVVFWDAANTNRLHFHEDLKTKFHGTVNYCENSLGQDVLPPTHDVQQQILIAKDVAPWIQATRTSDQAGSTQVELGKMVFSGHHSDVYRTGAKILAVTSSTEWDSVDTTLAPTELQFFTQSATAATDDLTSPVLTITSDGKLCASDIIEAEGQINATKGTGYSLVASSNIKATGYVEMTGINVLTGGTNAIAGDLGVTGAVTITKNLPGESLTIGGSAPVSITPGVTIGGSITSNGFLHAHGNVKIHSTSDLNCDAAADFASTVSIHDTLSLTKAGTGLSVTQDATIGGDLTVSGDIDLTGDISGANFTSTGVLTASGDNTALVVSNNASVGGTLTVTGAASVGALTGTATASFAGLVECNLGSGTGLAVVKNATVGGTLTVTGASTLTGAISTAAGITAAGKIMSTEATANVGLSNSGISELTGVVKCLAAIGNSLEVTNDAVVSGKLTLNKVTGSGVYGLSVTGNAQFLDDVEISEDLTVTGASGFTGLMQGVAATFTGALTANGGLTVGGNAAVSGTLSAGATTLDSASITTTLGVAGQLTASGSGTGLSVVNNASVGGTLTTTGTTTLNDVLTVNSTATMTGKLTLSESGTALDVAGNALVGGSLTLSGDLIVNGATTTVNTQTLTVTDNIIVVNESPLSSKDGGILMQRYSGDIVADTAKESGTLDGAGTSVATLPSGMVGAADDFYNGWYIKITNDSPAGALNQVREITDYTHSTRVLAIESDWTTQPDATSTFSLFNRSFVGVTYDESADEFALVATASNPADAVDIQEYLNLHVNNIVTAGNTTLGGDFTIGSLTITEPSDIEFNSSGPAMKFAKGGADKLLIDDAMTIYGNMTVDTGSISIGAPGGNALTITNGSALFIGVEITSTLTMGSTINSKWIQVATGAGINMGSSGAGATLRAYGPVDAYDTLTVTGTGDLDCDGPADFASTVGIGGLLTGESATFSTTLGVTGVATFTAQSVHTNGINAGTSDIDTLVVSGSGTALTVTNNMSALQVVAGASGVISNGPLDINSTSDFSDTLTISKASGTGLVVTADSTLTGDVSVGGDVDITGALTGAAATFDGKLTVTAATGVSVSNNITTGGVVCTGQLVVATTGSLLCAGTANFSKAVTLTNSMSGVSATLSTTLGVTGVATFTAQSVHTAGIDAGASDIDTLVVSGSGTALSVSANASVTGTLGVTGAATFTAQSVHNGGIDVNAASDITNLTVSGSGTALTVSNTASLGALSVSGTSSLTGVATLAAGFDSNAASTVSKLTIDGTDTTTLVVNKAASIGASLNVTGVATFNSKTTHNGGIIATGIETSDKIKAYKLSDVGLEVKSNTELKGETQCGPTISPSPHAGATLNLTAASSGPIMSFYNADQDFAADELLASMRFHGEDTGSYHRVGAKIDVCTDGTWADVAAGDHQVKAPSRIDFHVEDGTATTLADTPRFQIKAASIVSHADQTMNENCTIVKALTVSGASTTAAITSSGTVTINGSGTALVVANDIDVDGDSQLYTMTCGGAVNMGATLDVTGKISANKTGGDGTSLEVAENAVVHGDLVINGDFIVSGSTTTIDTATLAVEDHNIELGVVTTPSDVTADGGGITLKGTVDKTIAYDNTNKSWDSSEHVNVVTGKEYRIDDVAKLDNTTVYLGGGAGDGVVYMGDKDTDSSWRIDISGGDLRFSKRESGSWVTKQTIS
jgi:fibronectin-binding autotransporter adhesin